MSEQKDDVTLTAEEKAKGYQRPLRTIYKHVGLEGPKGALRDLTADEQKQFGVGGKNAYVKYEAYEEGHPDTGRYWTQEQLDRVGKGCGAITTLPAIVAEGFAQHPQAVHETACEGCKALFASGQHGEFVWVDGGQRVGT